MSKNVIFCYSGTGNCLDMAKNIARGLGDTDIIMMRAQPSVTDVRDAERVGFIFPCYGGGLPGNVEKYISLIKVSPEAYTFGVCQCSAYMGTGLYKLNERIHLDYWTSVTNPCTCIWLFPHTVMMPMMSMEAAQKRSEQKAADIAKSVLAGEKSKKSPPKRPLNAAESSVWPKLAKVKAAKFSVSENCIGCGQCEKLCPQGNIKIENKRAIIGRNCIQCLGCLQYCPQSAISIGKITDKREHYHNKNITAAELSEKLIHID